VVVERSGERGGKRDSRAGGVKLGDKLMEPTALPATVLGIDPPGKSNAGNYSRFPAVFCGGYGSFLIFRSAAVLNRPMLHLLGDIVVATGVGVLMVVFIAWTFRVIEAAIDRAGTRAPR
jgi:hypothetical protein